LQRAWAWAGEDPATAGVVKRARKSSERRHRGECVGDVDVVELDVVYVAEVWVVEQIEGFKQENKLGSLVNWKVMA
jgi:hypothetical protein